MIYRGTILTEASGSLNGTTFSHNRGGPYTRARVVPVNTETDHRLWIKAAFADSSQGYSQALTGDQRNNWRQLAARTERRNRIGGQIRPTAQQLYTGLNTPRLYAVKTGLASLAEITDAPDQAEWYEPYLTTAPADSGGTLVITFSADARFWQTDGAALLFFQSQQIPAVRSWFRGPYNLTTVISGNSGNSPQSVFNVGLAPSPDATSNVWWRFRITGGDGSLGTVASGLNFKP